MQAMNEELYQQKLMACWHGKNIGGTLGGPYEGFPQINHLTFYDPVPQEAMPNDDLELQAMYDYFDRIMRVGGGCYGKRQANGSC